jgi:hypothetical protein
MVTTAIRNPVNMTQERYSRLLDEVVVYCPNCKTLETLTLTRNRLATNRKFSLMDGRVYHNCGASVPCRLYRIG